MRKDFKCIEHVRKPVNQDQDVSQIFPVKTDSALKAFCPSKNVLNEAKRPNKNSVPCKKCMYMVAFPSSLF